MARRTLRGNIEYLRSCATTFPFEVDRLEQKSSELDSGLGCGRKDEGDSHRFGVR